MLVSINQSYPSILTPPDNPRIVVLSRFDKNQTRSLDSIEKYIRRIIVFSAENFSFLSFFFFRMEESRDSDLSKSKRWHTATRLPLPPMIRLTMSHCQSFRQSACSFFCASTADHYPVQGVKFSLRSGADVARL